MIKLSKTSKLGTPSWSLQAIETCPASLDDNGQLVKSCAVCYATDGNYRFASVKNVRAYNKKDWQRVDFVSDFVDSLRNVPHMRWFDSGDLYDIKLAKKLYDIMKLSPNTKFWLPTRMMKFPKFRAILNAMDNLPNVKVRFSSDDIDGSYTKGLHGSCIIPEANFITDANVCNAPSTQGKCMECRKCYDKDIPVIAYIGHGRKITKEYKIMMIKEIS